MVAEETLSSTGIDPESQPATVTIFKHDLPASFKERVQLYLVAMNGKADKAFSGSLPLLWFLVLLLLSFVLSFGTAYALLYSNSLQGTYSTTDFISYSLSFIPLLTVELFLGFPPARHKSTEILQILLNHPNIKWNVLGWVSIVAFVPLCWSLSSIIYVKTNPLDLVYITATCWALFQLWYQAHKYSISVLGKNAFSSDERPQEPQEGHGIVTVDIIAWLILYVPLDLRWYYDGGYYEGPPSMDYDWWALAITVIVLIGLQLFRPSYPGFGYRLIPSWFDLAITVAVLFVLSIVVIPLGLLTGFLEIAQTAPSFWDVICQWIENILTVAITEEIFFRVLLLNGIQFRYPSKFQWKAVAVSSIMFGIMHIPRSSGDPLTQFLYSVFAAICGVADGYLYILSGNNIVSPVLAHSLTDMVWKFAFQN